MRSYFLTAALALVLLCSLGGCNWDTASDFDDDNRLTASQRSAIERNGVHDGNDWDRRDWGDDIGDAGERAKNGLKDTARDITNGVNNATRNTENAINNAAR
ncbi:MAG: hypothetical protein K0S60_99 [Evtepia sp.]|jgi:hypothetical protein|nr:hypothetical protein [Evtepia sp.]